MKRIPQPSNSKCNTTCVRHAGNRVSSIQRLRDEVVVQRDGAGFRQQSAIHGGAGIRSDGSGGKDISDEIRVGPERRRSADFPKDISGLGTISQDYFAAGRGG